MRQVRGPRFRVQPQQLIRPEAAWLARGPQLLRVSMQVFAFHSSPFSTTLWCLLKKKKILNYYLHRFCEFQLRRKYIFNLLLSEEKEQLTQVPTLGRSLGTKLGAKTAWLCWMQRDSVVPCQGGVESRSWDWRRMGQLASSLFLRSPRQVCPVQI